MKETKTLFKEPEIEIIILQDNIKTVLESPAGNVDNDGNNWGSMNWF